MFRPGLSGEARTKKSVHLQMCDVKSQRSLALCSSSDGFAQPASAASFMGFGGNGKGWGPGWGWAPPMWIEPEMKIWIGNLPEDCTWKDLQTLGNTVAATRWAEVFRGKGKGTGVIAYKTAEDVTEAMKSLPGKEINGQTIQARQDERRRMAESTSCRSRRLSVKHGEACTLCISGTEPGL
eukprot:s5972_g3.t2